MLGYVRHVQERVKNVCHGMCFELFNHLHLRFEAAAANNLTHQQAAWGFKIWHIHIIHMFILRGIFVWSDNWRGYLGNEAISQYRLARWFTIANGCWWDVRPANGLGLLGGKIWSCQMMWVPGQLCELETLQFTFLFLCLNLCSPNICSSQKCIYIKIKIFPHVLYAVAWGHAKQYFQCS